MSPRHYDMSQRHEQVSLGRRQVLDAARALLREATTFTAFTVDAVAKGADVARATVYYQFGSKSGLLEALCDDLAAAGHMEDLAAAFALPDPAAAVDGFVRCFARFWDADRVVMRRLRALAALDTEVAAVIAARDERRMEGLDVLAQRLAGADPGWVRTAWALTAFETFDALSAPDQSLTEAASEVVRLLVLPC